MLQFLLQTTLPAQLEFKIYIVLVLSTEGCKKKEGAEDF